MPSAATKKPKKRSNSSLRPRQQKAEFARLFVVLGSGDRSQCLASSATKPSFWPPLLHFTDHEPASKPCHRFQILGGQKPFASLCRSCGQRSAPMSINNRLRFLAFEENELSLGRVFFEWI